MAYVDGFVAVVPAARNDAYISHAQAAADVFIAHGALSVHECWGDDVPTGEITSFPMAVQCAEDEIVVLSGITWPDRAARNAGWAAVMADPRMSADANPMPFDGKRLIYGGFEQILQAGS